MDIRKLFGKTIVETSTGKRGTISNVDCYEYKVDIWDIDMRGFFDFTWDEIEKAIEGKAFVDDDGESYIVII